MRCDWINVLFAEDETALNDRVLFGPEVGKYLDDMYHKGLALSTKAKIAGQEGLRTELIGWLARSSKSQRTHLLPTWIFAIRKYRCRGRNGRLTRLSVFSAATFLRLHPTAKLQLSHA
jgi:hypothetical protein